MQILLSILSNSITVLCKMSPYLLLGFLVAGILYVAIPQTVIEEYLGKVRRFRSVINAALVGIPLPLCSCSVIPVVTSLRQRGASKGATISFLLSAPQTGVDSFIVTLGALGPVIAVFRVIAALVSGVIGGLMVELLVGSDTEQNSAPFCEECCHSAKNQKSIDKFTQAMNYGFVFMPRQLAVPIVAGAVIAAIITIIVPASFVEKYIGTGIIGMLITMVFGMSMYVCATGSVPIAGALLAKGASAGAIFVFLMVGPATNAATITVIWKLLGTRNALIYLISLAVVSIGLGLLLNNLIPTAGKSQFINLCCTNPTVIEQILCVILSGLFAWSLLSKTKSLTQSSIFK